MRCPECWGWRKTLVEKSWTVRSGNHPHRLCKPIFISKFPSPMIVDVRKMLESSWNSCYYEYRGLVPPSCLTHPHPYLKVGILVQWTHPASTHISANFQAMDALNDELENQKEELRRAKMTQEQRIAEMRKRRDETLSRLKSLGIADLLDSEIDKTTPRLVNLCQGKSGWCGVGSRLFDRLFNFSTLFQFNSFNSFFQLFWSLFSTALQTLFNISAFFFNSLFKAFFPLF